MDEPPAVEGVVGERACRGDIERSCRRVGRYLQDAPGRPGGPPRGRELGVEAAEHQDQPALHSGDLGAFDVAEPGARLAQRRPHLPPLQVW